MPMVFEGVLQVALGLHPKVLTGINVGLAKITFLIGTGNVLRALIAEKDWERPRKTFSEFKLGRLD